MAKTDWKNDDIVKAQDMNDIGEEINNLRTDIDNIHIPDASLTEKGITQLSSATDSTAEDRAATPKAVKGAYDAASAAQSTANAANTAAVAAQLTADRKLDASAYNATDVLAKILTVDGAGSRLDADLLDGVDGSGYTQTSTAGLRLRVNGVGLEYSTDGGVSWRGVGGVKKITRYMAQLPEQRQDGTFYKYFYDRRIGIPAVDINKTSVNLTGVRLGVGFTYNSNPYQMQPAVYLENDTTVRVLIHDNAKDSQSDEYNIYVYFEVIEYN